MKRSINYSKLSVFGCLWVAAALLFSSCLKSRPGSEDFSGLKPTVLIPEGGLSTFASEAFTFPGSDLSDTASFHVNYAATDVAPTDETITIAVDPDALAAYNSSHTIQFQLFPDSIYSFTTTTVTVKKGNNYSDAIPIAVFPSKVDPTQNYMLPISIKSAPAGAIISGNYQTIYYHFIGNPIAGSYVWDFTRWNATDSTGPNSGHVIDQTVFAPDDPNTVEVATGYFTQPRYVIHFDNNAGVLSNFTVTFNPDDITFMHDNGVDVGSAPVIIVADPVNENYEFQWSAAVIAGGSRYIIDKYHK